MCLNEFRTISKTVLAKSGRGGGRPPCRRHWKRIAAALLVIDLGKAKALHAFREKVKKSKPDTSIEPDTSIQPATSIDLTWKKIDNNKEKMRTEENQESLELKSNSSLLLYAFDDENFLNIWVLNSEDGVKTFKHNKLLEKIDVLLKFLLENCNVNLNRDLSFHKLYSGFTLRNWVNPKPRLPLVSCQIRSQMKVRFSVIHPQLLIC